MSLFNSFMRGFANVINPFPVLSLKPKKTKIIDTKDIWKEADKLLGNDLENFYKPYWKEYYKNNG